MGGCASKNGVADCNGNAQPVDSDAEWEQTVELLNPDYDPMGFSVWKIGRPVCSEEW